MTIVLDWISGLPGLVLIVVTGAAVLALEMKDEFVRAEEPAHDIVNLDWRARRLWRLLRRALVLLLLASVAATVIRLILVAR